MQTPPSAPTKSAALGSALKKNLLYLGIILVVACGLATIFTAFTPGADEPNASVLIAQRTVSIPTLLAPGAPTPTHRATPLIGIVAGHWKNDSGAVCVDGFQEVDINLNIASLVQKILAEKGYEVQLLSEFDPELTNFQADALVSIHADSCDFINAQATGFKVASAMGSRYPEYAARLTACLRGRYGQMTGLPLHSTSVTNDMTNYHAFGEINENTPASIIETGFLNLDRQFLTEKPDLAAQGIAAGIICFIQNEPISTPSPVPIPSSAATGTPESSTNGEPTTLPTP